ncbi:MAG: hypothetical protein JXR76_17690 [Deltaproteobacteria bacterium]|nr:hypothetical protein [Deltaproteobacteria bacterium]
MKEKLQSIYRSPVGDPARLARYLVRLLGDERVPKSAKLKLLGSGLYAWIEGDIIADGASRLIPGLGLVDDVILVVHGVKCLIAETEPKVAVELWPGDEASFARTMTAVAKLDDTLFGNVRRAVLDLFNRVTGQKKSTPPVPQLLQKD